nr:hypothetical protein Iba_chr09bCG8430 [Ipomoea batatas]GMD38774.1 hypothetical protein Iba_chr09fCG7240 [Ipomoea batatas]GME19260.1 hypothetical protein Iba_scaffold22292CG0010 [Ipomoea batatas]
MLSHPSPPDDGAKHLSRTFWHTTESLFPLFKLSLTKSTSCWLDMTYHIPSHARTRKSSSAQKLTVLMSGLAVTICLSAGKVLFCFSSMSPEIIAKFKLPLTRPH